MEWQSSVRPLVSSREPFEPRGTSRNLVRARRDIFWTIKEATCSETGLRILRSHSTFNLLSALVESASQRQLEEISAAAGPRYSSMFSKRPWLLDGVQPNPRP